MSNELLFPISLVAAITLGVVFSVGYSESRREEMSGETSWITYLLISASVTGYGVVFWLSGENPLAGDFMAVSLGLFIGGYAVILAAQAVRRLRAALRKSRRDRHS